MEAGRTWVVLGANRGIGRALGARLAARRRPGDVVVLTARTAAAASEVSGAFAEQGLEVQTDVFDLADALAPQRLAERLGADFGGVDLLIQNGAYTPRPDAPAAEDARPMIAANNHGTLRVLEAFLPITKPGGRLIVVASGFGVLASLPESLRPRFDTRAADPEAIGAAMDDYVESVEQGRAEAEGWPAWVNVPSKVGQVAVTRAFARRARRDGQLPRDVLIDAACPGVTLTDATRPFMGTVFREEDAQTPDAAAAGLLALADVPAGATEPFGELVQHGRVLPFGD